MWIGNWSPVGMRVGNICPVEMWIGNLSTVGMRVGNLSQIRDVNR